MINILILLILQQSTFIKNVIIECKNGGPNGFNSSTINCDMETGKYLFKFNDPGYEKFKLCEPLKTSKEISKIVSMSQSLINNNKNLDTTFIQSNYSCSLNIKNQFNYKIEIKSINN